MHGIQKLVKSSVLAQLIKYVKKCAKCTLSESFSGGAPRFSTFLIILIAIGHKSQLAKLGNRKAQYHCKSKSIPVVHRKLDSVWIPKLQIVISPIIDFLKHF